jgi:hypothetical protein
MTKTYTVTITDKYPAAGERPSQVEVRARNKREAISLVRRAGWRSRYDSPAVYTAEED